MVDELDLAFDDHAEQPSTRHRRAPRSTGKSSVAFLMAFILLAVLGGGVYFGYSKVKEFFEDVKDKLDEGVDKVRDRFNKD